MNMRKESEMFDRMSEYYDKFRPDYPEKVIDTIVNIAGLTKGSRILEIGAGSGKATSQFVDYDFEMLCLDPGADLVRIGNERFKGKNILFTKARFEEYDLPAEYYDAVISGQAFHWIPKPLGYELCSKTLKPGGWLMPFWNIELIDETPLDRELLQIFEKYNAFTATINVHDYKKRVTSIRDSIESSGLFKDIDVINVKHCRTYTADEYFGYIMTGNIFVQNPTEMKKECYNKLLKIADKYGNIRREFICELYVARKT